MRDRMLIARNLAAAFLAGDWTERALLEQSERVLGEHWPKLRRTMVRSVLRGCAKSPVPPAPADLIAIIERAENFARIAEFALRKHWIHRPQLAPPQFAPAPRFAATGVPVIATAGELADWLGISIAHLDWFADSRRLQGRTNIPILQHYTYVFVPKRTGTPRLIEAPKSHLKLIQRKILHGILDKATAHEAAHGFVTGRSALTGASVHAGEAIVATLDLQNFFPATRLSRVHALFRALGYPHGVARLLTRLVSTVTPAAVFERLPPERRHDWTTRQVYRSPHLAQGAPTSPALANLAVFGLDRRLTGLAAKFGARYTRYADDLAFSGDVAFAGAIERFLISASLIIREEGYAVNVAKTRVMRAAQRQIVTGLVVNSQLAVSRAAYDQLKAVLHDCRRDPAAANRDCVADFRAHLDGRIGWHEQVNPARGAKLRRRFELIVW